MKYIYDHDLHIHTRLSACSGDPEQTPENILRFAETAGLKKICITDHYWDNAVPGASEWYLPQDYAHLSQSKPMPQSGSVQFLFGCEAEQDKTGGLSIPPQRYDCFDFIIISTTHMHRLGLTVTEDDVATSQNRAQTWIRRLEAVLDTDLPFYKVGLAHLTCPLITYRDRAGWLETLSLLPDREMYRLFSKAAALGAGIELNAGALQFTDSEADTVLRPYRIAKNVAASFIAAAIPTDFFNCRKPPQFSKKPLTCWSLRKRTNLYS